MIVRAVLPMTLVLADILIVLLCAIGLGAIGLGAIVAIELADAGKFPLSVYAWKELHQ